MHQAVNQVNQTNPTPVTGNVSTDPILIVDDDPDCCRMTADVLERAGYRVEWTVDPLYALPRIRERRYAMVVSDVAMPAMRGTKLAAETARLKPRVPILLMSARADDGTRAVAHALGVPLVTKPFRAPALLAAVGGLVGEPPEQRLSERCG
jgi:DNA-binding response OmpR family regulator